MSGPQTIRRRLQSIGGSEAHSRGRKHRRRRRVRDARTLKMPARAGRVGCHRNFHRFEHLGGQSARHEISPKLRQPRFLGIQDDASTRIVAKLFV